MVRDENNFPEVKDALENGLQNGLLELHEETLDTLLSNMEDGKDALGREWEPIKPETLRSREVRTGSPSPLMDTGIFRADINKTSGIDLNRLTAVIGTGMQLGVIHELGAPEAGIPRRPIFAPAAAYAERRATDIIGREIDIRLQGAML